MTSFKLDHDDLETALNFAKTILADRSIKDEAKQIVFIVNQEEVTIGASTSRGTVSINVPVHDVVIPEDGWEFQTKYTDLVNILGSYGNLSLTKIDYIQFEDTERIIRILIREEPLDEENTQFAQDVYFNLAKAIPPAKVVSKFRQERPEVLEELEIGVMSTYLNGMVPKLSNDASGSVSSELHISKEFVLVQNSAALYAFHNTLPEVFENIVLGGTYLESIKSMMKYAVDNETVVQVGQAGQNLYLESESVRLYLQVKMSRLNYKSITDTIFEKGEDDKFVNRGLGVVVNRAYFQDVLPRLLVGGSQSRMVNVRFTENTMKLETDGFNQEIPLDNSKGEIEKVAFKATISVLTNSLIDGGEALKDFTDIRMFFNQTKNGYTLYIMDGSGLWVTSMTASGVNA